MRSHGGGRILAGVLGVAAAAVLLVARADQAPGPGSFGPCRVARVIDGDTVDVNCAGEGQRVRLLRINTPERGRPGYAEASETLATLVSNRSVFLTFENPGRPERGGFGRLLAYVWADGRNLNVEMVRLGWSPFWTKYGTGRFAAEFRAAEREARERGIGLWGGNGAERATEPATSRSERAGRACVEREDCCRVCRAGIPCGDSCILASAVCRSEPGCACHAVDLCR